MEVISLLCTKPIKTLGTEVFFKKIDNNFMKRVQIVNNFKTKRKSSIFKKLILKETNKISIGDLHSLFFVTGTDEDCFDKAGNANSSF